MQAGVTVSFYGVRGSTPCHCKSMARVGGNTSCVVIQRDGEKPIICDAGTGLRFFGLDMGADSFDGTVLISHLHWDHVQGLPFFPQLLNSDSAATVYGPPEDDMSFEEALSGFVRPPYFPVRLSTLPGDLAFTDLANDTVSVDGASITARPVPHSGNTNGYRIEWPDFSVAYIPDHQEPADGTSIAPGVKELVDGVDLVIHDAQFTSELLAKRSDWGHCTPTYALHIAETCGAAKLAMFHHDPLHSDDVVDALLAETQSQATSCEVLAATEGLKLSF